MNRRNSITALFEKKQWDLIEKVSKSLKMPPGRFLRIAAITIAQKTLKEIEAKQLPSIFQDGGE